MRGFEPPVSCSRSKRRTRLGHTLMVTEQVKLRSRGQSPKDNPLLLFGSVGWGTRIRTLIERLTAASLAIRGYPNKAVSPACLGGLPLRPKSSTISCIGSGRRTRTSTLSHLVNSQAYLPISPYRNIVYRHLGQFIGLGEGTRTPMMSWLQTRRLTN